MGDLYIKYIASVVFWSSCWGHLAHLAELCFSQKRELRALMAPQDLTLFVILRSAKRGKVEPAGP